jgi:toxin ParE1/3/4
VGQFNVVFTPEAQAPLVELHRYISNAATPATAERFINAIIDQCENLQNFPLRGTLREDIRPGLRTIHYKSRTIITYFVDADLISILGIFYGGQDFRSALQSP